MWHISKNLNMTRRVQVRLHRGWGWKVAETTGSVSLVNAIILCLWGGKKVSKEEHDMIRFYDL